MPTSTVGARCCLMVTDDTTYMGWPFFLLNKSAATVTLGFPHFLGGHICLREA